MKVKATLCAVYNPESGELATEIILRRDGKDVCYGQRTGLSGEMCGGCPACLLAQAYYYEYKIEFSEIEIEDD